MHKYWVNIVYYSVFTLKLRGPNRKPETQLPSLTRQACLLQFLFNFKPHAGQKEETFICGNCGNANAGTRSRPRLCMREVNSGSVGAWRPRGPRTTQVGGALTRMNERMKERKNEWVNRTVSIWDFALCICRSHFEKVGDLFWPDKTSLQSPSWNIHLLFYDALNFNSVQNNSFDWSET